MHEVDLPPDHNQDDPVSPVDRERNRRTVKSTPATAMLAGEGLPYALHNLVPDPGDSSSDATSLSGSEKANYLGVDTRRMLKTVIVSMGPELVSATIPVSSTLDLHSLAAAAGARSATLCDPGISKRASGYEVSCTSPLGLATDLPAIVDVSAMAFPSVLVESGVPGLYIELVPGQLINVLRARTAPITAR